MINNFSIVFNYTCFFFRFELLIAVNVNKKKLNLVYRWRSLPLLSAFNLFCCAAAARFINIRSLNHTNPYFSKKHFKCKFLLSAFDLKFAWRTTQNKQQIPTNREFKIHSLLLHCVVRRATRNKEIMIIVFHFFFSN